LLLFSRDRRAAPGRASAAERARPHKRARRVAHRRDTV